MESAKESVTALLNDVGHIPVIDLDLLALTSYVSSSSFQGLQFVWWWGMAAQRGMVEGRERSWNDLERIVDKLVNGYNCVLRNLNG